MAPRELHIGVDFDNTIVSYDTLFHRLAEERSLIPAGLPATKVAVRDHLRAIGNEPAWTALQGIAYGERMADAAPFPGVFDTLRACLVEGARVSIISHRTKAPIVGEPVDLHAAARHWLVKQGVLDFIEAGDVHFELTRDAKVERLRAANCHSFIDDLPEFLCHPGFPTDVRRVLFDPTDAHPPDDRWTTVRSWHDVGARPLEFFAPREH